MIQKNFCSRIYRHGFEGELIPAETIYSALYLLE